MNIKLNQEVLLVGIGNNARYSTPKHKAIVSKVGRKWFKLEVENNPYIGRDNQFSLENGMSDGKGYSSVWIVYESETDYENEKRLPILRREIIQSVEKLSYTQLSEILKFIKEL